MANPLTGNRRSTCVVGNSFRVTIHYKYTYLHKFGVLAPIILTSHQYKAFLKPFVNPVNTRKGPYAASQRVNNMNIISNMIYQVSGVLNAESNALPY